MAQSIANALRPLESAPGGPTVMLNPGLVRKPLTGHSSFAQYQYSSPSRTVKSRTMQPYPGPGVPHAHWMARRGGQVLSLALFHRPIPEFFRAECSRFSRTDHPGSAVSAGGGARRRHVRERVPENTLDAMQRAVHVLRAPTDPARRPGQFDVQTLVPAQRFQTRRLLGRTHHRLDLRERPREARRQTVGEQTEGAMPLGTVPARHARARRGDPRIGPVPGRRKVSAGSRGLRASPSWRPSCRRRVWCLSPTARPTSAS